MADRRTLLRWGSAAMLGVALPGTTAMLASTRRRDGDGQAAGSRTPSGAPPPEAFVTPLPVPAVLRPVSSAGGVDRYEIRQTEGRQRILPDRDTTIWGYNGTFPGPTIETRSGRKVVVTHRNELSVPTVVHLHGGIVAADSDGYPADLVLPADGQVTDPRWAEHAQHGVAGLAVGSRDYAYPNEQPAATLWYHDHRMDFTGPQLYRGLAGFYLIRDDIEDALPLPGGDRDVPLMIADRTVQADGSLFYPLRDPKQQEPGVTVQYHHSGMVGNTITVNGVAWPFHEVDAVLYRLRILNASNARPYQLVLDPPPPGGKGFIQIGSDAGLLAQPVRHDEFVISPGERYDMLVDFSAYRPGTQVRLRNSMGEGAASYVMRFDVARQAADDARIPDSFGIRADPTAPPGKTGDRKFSFFSGPEGTRVPGLINLKSFDPARIDARPTLGTTEIWNITADPSHPVHIHMAHFRVLSRDGRAPDPQDTGWKDTIYLASGGVKVEVAFTGHPGKHVFHCHNVEHSDTGMMTNVEIV
jgi:spore coat protein A, manganese oxidase